MNIDNLQHNAQRASTFLKALSSPHRLMILCHLIGGELSVSELNDKLQLSQSALSQHLAVLREHKIVETRRESQVIYYRVEEPAVIDIINVLYRHYCQ